MQIDFTSLINFTNLRGFTKEQIYNYLKVFTMSNHEDDEVELKGKNADEEDYETMSDIYNDYYDKLEYVKQMDENDPMWITYTNLLMLIKSSVTNKPVLLETLLSAAPVLKLFRESPNLSDDNLLMVSFCTRQKELADYSFYLVILAEEDVATRITNKSSNLDDQFDIAEAVMEYLDDTGEDCIHAEDFEKYKNGCLEVIDTFQIAKTK